MTETQELCRSNTTQDTKEREIPQKSCRLGWTVWQEQSLGAGNNLQLFDQTASSQVASLAQEISKSSSVNSKYLCATSTGLS